MIIRQYNFATEQKRQPSYPNKKLLEKKQQDWIFWSDIKPVPISTHPPPPGAQRTQCPFLRQIIFSVFDQIFGFLPDLPILLHTHYLSWDKNLFLHQTGLQEILSLSRVQVEPRYLFIRLLKFGPRSSPLSWSSAKLVKTWEPGSKTNGDG